MHAGLWLYEELFLLALNPERGAIPLTAPLEHVIIGAALTDLLLDDRIRIEKKGRSNRVVVFRTSLTGEPILDECLERIRKSQRTKSVQTWVATLAGLKNLTHGTAERLVRRGIVRREEQPFLVFFTRRIYPIVNGAKRAELVEHLRTCVRTEGEPPARAAALLALLKYAGLLATLFDSAERRTHRTRIKQIAKSHPMVGAVDDALAAVHAVAAAAG
jgi:hypothetical protein